MFFDGFSIIRRRNGVAIEVKFSCNEFCELWDSDGYGFEDFDC